MMKVRRTGKGFYLFPHDVYTAVVTGVELENHLSHVLGTVYSSC